MRRLAHPRRLLNPYGCIHKGGTPPLCLVCAALNWLAERLLPQNERGHGPR